MVIQIPIIGIGMAARIAAVVAKSPTVKAGIKKAIEKFGKEAVKKHAGKVPSVVRSSKITKSAKKGRKSRAKSKAFEKDPKHTRTSDWAPSSRVERGLQAARTRKKRILRGETPDRTSTLGKRGYNPYVMKEGGAVKRYKGGLMVKPKAAKRGY